MPECNNFIHLGCSKMMLKTFGEEEWEGLWLCGKWCFKHHIKSLTSVESQIPKRVPWSSDGLVDEVSSMSVLIDWLTIANNYNSGMEEIIKMGQQIQYSPINYHSLWPKWVLRPKGQGRIFTTKSTIWSSSLELPGIGKIKQELS